jgi:protein phosphatase 2C-like protein
VWRPIAQSLQGPSHFADGSPCQDCHCVRVFGAEAEETLVACVADGAGSAKFSDVGSSMACAAILENSATYFDSKGGFDELQLEDVLSWCDDARSRIRGEASTRDCGVRELSTTLVVAIIAPQRAYFFQIGDGAIVVGNHGVYGVVFWPQSGEYANTTNFITSDEYRSRLDFLTTSGRLSDVALFTDGLERLALRFDSQTPHAPFFEPLFRTVRAADDLNILNEQLRRFLGADSVQSRSDDDKTLILASRRAADHAI